MLKKLIEDQDRRNYDDTPSDDPDDHEWTAEDFARARPASEVLPPELYAHMTGRRGPQRAAKKVQVTVRLNAEVVEKYRAGGRGWQTRLNDDLEKLKLG